jgi:ribonuclease III
VKPDDEAQLDALQRHLGVQFRNPQLLEQALIHRSLLRESAYEGRQSNERLEFLGDAIIGAFVASFLYRRLPNASEGELTLLRTWLVRASTLSEWATSLDLERYLRLGRSDEGGKRRSRLMARTFEALVGAVYVDQGSRGATRFLRPFVVREFRRRARNLSHLDAKSRLQQVTQGRFDLIPAYKVQNVSGPGHDPTFTVEVQLGSALRMSADGRTKQEAEQAAARLALEVLEAAPTAQEEVEILLEPTSVPC